MRASVEKRSMPAPGHLLGAGGRVLLLLLLFGLPLWPQKAAPAPAPATQKPEAPKDALGRTTPRGTVLGFLNASRKGSNEIAAQYLNTRLRGAEADTLAHQLFVVLDRRLPTRLTQLSDQPEGSLSNPLNPSEDLIGTISSAGGNIDIIVERVDRKKAGTLWLFSQKTLAAIPDVYQEVNVVSVENVLPEFLVKKRIAGVPLFEWLAVLIGMPVFYLLIGMLSRILSPAVRLLLRRIFNRPNLGTPEVFPPPLRLLFLALAIRWLLSNISLPLFARQIWSAVALILATAAVVWLLILATGVVEAQIRQRLQTRNRTGATAMLRLARRVVDLLFIFGGAIAVLAHFGINPTAALAGLGIGGIAVALAAQKTLENVIGGISLIFDQPVQVGETVKVGDSVGAIEAIGLRSTRIRTVDRTMLSVPNGQIASMSLENLSARDKFWFHQILGLRYGTRCSQVRTVLEAVRGLLEQCPQVERGTFRVNLLRLGPSSMDVEVAAYVRERDYNEFLKLQESLLLRILECVESAGAQMALPNQAVFMAPSAERAARGPRPLASKKADRKGAVAKSA